MVSDILGVVGMVVSNGLSFHPNLCVMVIKICVLGLFLGATIISPAITTLGSSNQFHHRRITL
jgi:hypothetical protein